ncbi:putative epoxide hydrolase [Hyaloraphidium curvatum]|nr:putative epoxide hydrolase [Hyaloraphidium curvatum]
MRYPALPGVAQHRAAVNGIELDYLEAGPADGPLVVLLHGFPESSWSWRHQLPALAAAGFRAVAPDQRGYAGSTRPSEVSAYGTTHLEADALALVDRLLHPGAKAIFVGHDWGALLVWDLVRDHPSRVRAAVAVSVPYTPWPAKPTDVLKAMRGDKFHYILYFQSVGPPEAEMDPQRREVLRRTVWAVAGSKPGSNMSYAAPDVPAEGGKIMDTMADTPEGLPPFLTEAEFDAWAAAYDESGFFGPISWYRNLDTNYERTKSIPPSVVSMPVFFIGSERDPVLAGQLDKLDAVHAALPGYRGHRVLSRAGHWTQQEEPEAFNEALLGFLSSLPPADA